MRTLILLALALFCQNLLSQNIFSAIRLNEAEHIDYGQVISYKQTQWSYGSWGLIISNSEKILNETNHLLTETRYEDGVLKAKLEFFYDEKTGLQTKRIMERWHPLIGSQKETAYYFYDDKGYHIGVAENDAKGNLFQKTVIIPNEDGLPGELRVYDGNGNIYGWYEKATYLKEANKYISTVFDAKGNIITQDTAKLSYAKNAKNFSALSVLDEHGNCLRYDVSSKRYELSVYTYDERGNWVFRKTYQVDINKNGKHKKTLEQKYKRKLVYRE